MGGGVCYGAALDSNLNVIHRRADTLKDCFAFKGSKYVQSWIDVGIFREIKVLLDYGKIVLFSGTGCQVHGLLSYLNQTKTICTKLITVDFVCHGVPSSGVWDEYKKAIESQSKKKLVEVKFRDKENFGWSSNIESYRFEDGSTEYNSKWADVYYQHCMFRDACYKCPYTTPYRESDFTIGDYWGYEKVIDGYRDNKGLSLVITHNQKAEKILSELNNLLYILATDFEMSMQPQLRYPAYKGLEYNRFWNIWNINKEKAVKIFFFPSHTRQLYLKVFKHLKRIVKHSIRIFKSIRY